MKKSEKMFNTIDEVLNAGDFFKIYEYKGEKRISFGGYIYTEGQEGINDDGEEDIDWCYRIVEYSDGMDFSLEEYLSMTEEEHDHAYDVRGNDYIGDATEEMALEAANNWFGEGVTFSRTWNLTMDMPVGYYV